MPENSLRIKEIQIENFKNVVRGEINMETKHQPGKASVAGLYGQNGSGKTALIDALGLLRDVLAGKAVPARFADYINIDAPAASFSYRFELKRENAAYTVWYSFSLRKVVDEAAMDAEEHITEDIDGIAAAAHAKSRTGGLTAKQNLEADAADASAAAHAKSRTGESSSMQNIEADTADVSAAARAKSRTGESSSMQNIEADAADAFAAAGNLDLRDKRHDRDIRYKVEIADEVLSYAVTAGEKKKRRSVLINTGTDGIFLPRAKCAALIGSENWGSIDMLVQKQVIRMSARSFIFSREMRQTFRNACREEEYLYIINRLHVFGVRELFVVNTENSGMISRSLLPITFNYKQKQSIAYGSFVIKLNEPFPIPAVIYPLAENIIACMNIVLEKIIPGLTVEIVNLGRQLSKKGEEEFSIQLLSNRDGRRIPFQYESEGIKKIVSVLQLLICVYNNPSITVAVDEIDSGIFEYLLGELMKIISEHGKGQLIFTSHNLRPLETIDKNFIVFTTTDPANRYVRMTKIAANNNPRDVYYRNILLGADDVRFYQPTNNFEIDMAFRKAGEALGG